MCSIQGIWFLQQEHGSYLFMCIYIFVKTVSASLALSAWWAVFCSSLRGHTLLIRASPVYMAFIYVHIYIYTHVYIYIYAYLYLFVYTYIHMPRYMRSLQLCAPVSQVEAFVLAVAGKQAFSAQRCPEDRHLRFEFTLPTRLPGTKMQHSRI